MTTMALSTGLCAKMVSRVIWSSLYTIANRTRRGKAKSETDNNISDSG